MGSPSKMRYGSLVRDIGHPLRGYYIYLIRLQDMHALDLQCVSLNTESTVSSLRVNAMLVLKQYGFGNYIESVEN